MSAASEEVQGDPVRRGMRLYNQGCNEKFQGAMKDYFLGTVDSYEAALENFKKNITDLYGNLTCDF